MRELLNLDGRCGELARLAATAESVAALAVIAAAGRNLAAALLDAGAGAGYITGLLSALNDSVVSRVLALTEKNFRLPPASWCWLAFGSEGRGEQTLVTDQDNGLIFSAADHAEAEALRQRFLPFAAAANRALAECGFSLCPGGIMAGNPSWCLSVDEWKQRFFSWIRTPEPEALLNASIFFDFRALHGDAALASALASQLARMAPGSDAFLRMMAANAFAAEAPIGRLRDFVTEGGGAATSGTVDLKKFGSRLFVDVARICALAGGVAAASTVERLRLCAPSLRLSSSDLDALINAFLAIQSFRLGVQRRSTEDAAGANRVSPQQLGEFDRRVLLEAFKQARQLQRLLKHQLRIDE
jgi:CBS domain-containing protein